MTNNFAGKFWSFSFYMMFFAAVAALYNFVVLFYDNQGLPGSQIGVLMSMGSLLGMFAGPLLSGLADASRQHRLVLSLAVIGSLSTIFCFPFFHSFWAFFFLITLQSVFSAPIIPLVDNATLAILGEQKRYYGLVRLGGTIGYGLTGPIASLVVERYGLQWSFWMYSAFLLVGLIAVQQLHFSQKPTGQSFLHGVRQVLGERRWIVFLAVAMMAGIGTGIISSYLFLYLERIGTSTAWMGWALTISTGTELVILLFASPLMKNFKARGLLTLGLAGTAIRCMLYGVTSIPWMALAIQLLQAVSYPLILVAGVSYADEIAPAGMGATGQGIFNSAFMGIGFALGGFFGGVLSQYIGVQQMFLVIGAVVMIAAIVYGVLPRTDPAPQPA